MKYTLIVVAVLCIAITGGKEKPAGWGVRTISRSNVTAGESPVDGLDRYSANFWTIGDQWASHWWQRRGLSFHHPTPKGYPFLTPKR